MAGTGFERRFIADRHRALDAEHRQLEASTGPLPGGVFGAIASRLTAAEDEAIPAAPDPYRAGIEALRREMNK